MSNVIDKSVYAQLKNLKMHTICQLRRFIAIKNYQQFNNIPNIPNFFRSKYFDKITIICKL